MAYDKNVFILGAGASKAAGAPLLNEFLATARELLDNHQYSGLDEDPADKEAFETVFKWRSSLYRVLRYLNIDFDNLEDLFSFVDMSRQFGSKQAGKVREALIRLACRTIELSVKISKHKPGGIAYLGDPEYIKLARWLGERRQEQINSEGVTGENSIITMNYDTLIEQALKDVIHSKASTYGPPWHKPIQNTRQTKVLKLHGSINWAKCTKCEYTWAEPEPKPLPTVMLKDFYMQPSSQIYNKPCPECRNGKLEPFIVPPTWNKGGYGKPLEQVWKSAFDEIKEAHRLIIIGYSLPETDSYFKYLLAIALSENESLRNIIVVDPAGDAIEQRYSTFLTPNFRKRNFTFHPLDFRDWLDERLGHNRIPQ